MSNWIEVVSDAVVNVIVYYEDPTGSFPTAGEWLAQPYGVGIGWTRVGAVWTGPNGEPQPVPPVPVPRYRTLLTGPEWVEAFNDTEWAWLKTQRAMVTRLDQMMDAIRWTDSVNVASPNMDEFYNWLLNNGLPGGQTRIDELRAGILE
jgi:hypothetical protein